MGTPDREAEIYLWIFRFRIQTALWSGILRFVDKCWKYETFKRTNIDGPRMYSHSVRTREPPYGNITS